eukprot:COSAG06_NODE_363_length_16808_cov_11.122509_8_plen_147_part_00
MRLPARPPGRVTPRHRRRPALANRCALDAGLRRARGTESAAARAPESLRRFWAWTGPCDGYPGRRRTRLQAASDAEGARAVLSTNFDRLSDREPKVHLEVLSQAAARVPGPLRRFRARPASCGGYPGRRSKRLEAASDTHTRQRNT